jgi:holo-[acyl-carrier protein] synthase
MIMGIGTDLVNSNRIEHIMARFGKRFLNRCFTNNEQSYYQLSPLGYAKAFAAKEAFVKALGTGFRYGITFHDMDIGHSNDGGPFFQITGQALIQLNKKAGPNARVFLTLTDESPYAQAFVIIEQLK